MSINIIRNLLKLTLTVCWCHGAALFAGEFVDPASEGAAPSVAEIAAKGYKLAFSDEFNGDKVDEGKWQYRWDSKGQSTQLPANVTVSGGAMRIAVKKEQSQGKEHTAGGLITKRELLHGYYEARFKVPAGRGWHTSFFAMYYNGKDTTNVRGRQEIDICEQDSTSGDENWGYAYCMHDWGSKFLPKGEEVPAPRFPEGRKRPPSFRGDLREFHTWGLEFTEKDVNFYFEGELRGSVDATLFKHTSMNVWLTSIGWAGVVDAERLPSEAVFDYFRFYTLDGTLEPETEKPVEKK